MKTEPQDVWLSEGGDKMHHGAFLQAFLSESTHVKLDNFRKET